MAAVPYQCDDFVHCAAGFPGHVCDVNVTHGCPGLAPDETPDSHSGTAHPDPHNPNAVTVCRRCITHDGAISLRDRITNPAFGGHPPFPGFRGQLCMDCITNEVSLYWRRSGRAQPTVDPSMALVQSWPSVQGATQDLCICLNKAVVPFQNHCHQCRDHAFNNKANNDRNANNDILRHYKKSVITGDKTLSPNGANQRLRYSNAAITKRTGRGIHRLCPCGKETKRRAVPQGREYCTICLACMGVKITSRHLPAPNPQTGATLNLRADRFGTRFSPRTAGVTKGPKKAKRSERFRVNIERAWVDDDPFVTRT